MRKIFLFIFPVLLFALLSSCKSGAFLKRKYRPGIFFENVKAADHLSSGNTESRKIHKKTQIVQNIPIREISSWTTAQKIPSPSIQYKPIYKPYKTTPDDSIHKAELEQKKKQAKRLTRAYTISGWSIIGLTGIAVETGMLAFIATTFILSLLLCVLGFLLLRKLKHRDYDTFSQKWKIILCLVFLFTNVLLLLISVLPFLYLYI